MFVDVIRYRIHLMRKKIDPKGPEASEQISNFKCPTCLKVITLLEAMKSPDIEQNFVCTSCCPHDNFRGLSSELWCV
jgi:transcription initiation factor IIE alpha subunit